MFRPYKHTGGDYTDIVSISTNIPYNDASHMSTFISTFVSTSTGFIPTGTDQYKNIAQANLILIAQALDTPNKITSLTQQYQSTLSSMSTQIRELEQHYDSQYLSSISSQTDKETAWIQYGLARSTLSTYDGYTLFSSQYYSSMLDNLSTVTGLVAPSISTLVAQSTVQVQENSTLIGIFNNSVAISTFNGDQISTNKGILEGYNARIIPSSISTLDSLSSIYSTSIVNYDQEDLRILQEFSTYGPTFSSISTITSRKRIIENLLLQTHQDYTTATSIIRHDNYIIEYLNSMNLDANTYAIYNSTITTMQEIETLYSLVMSGLSVPTQLVNTIGVQGGGAYIPRIQISSFTCNPNDTACNAKLSYLQKYFTVYFSLSTAFPTYEASYADAHEARLAAEANTQLRLTSTLQDMLAQYDLDLSSAQETILRKTNVISELNIELSRLNIAYSSLTVNISTSLFTASEYDYLLEHAGQQGGGISSPAGTINVPVNPYTEPVIYATYSSSLSTYSERVILDTIARAGLEQIYNSTLIQLQKINNINIYHHDTRDNIGNEIRALEPILDKNRVSLSSLQYTSTLISSAIVMYTELQKGVGHTIQNALQRSANILTPFEASTIKLNNSLENYYLSELNDYITTITQISTHVLFDTAKKQMRDLDGPDNAISPSTMDSISQLIPFLAASDFYIATLEAEKLYKSNYIQTKRVYELQEGYIASGVRKLDLLTPNDFNNLKIDYDIFVEQVNSAISARSTLNAQYVSSMSTILPILEVATQQELREPYSLTIPSIQIETTYLTSIGLEASLGSITADPIRGNLYVYDYSKAAVLRVSNNLSQIIDRVNIPVGPYVFITAYDGIVYATDYFSSKLYSINYSQGSTPTPIQINTNLLNGPLALSNIVNNKFYIVNHSSPKSIVSVNITNNVIEVVASHTGTGVNISNFGNIFGIVVDSNNILYAVDNGTRIVKINLQTNTSSVLAGHTSTGYIDGLGASARFDANFNYVCPITIDSQNNIFICDKNNNAIRKIDSEGNVTTYMNKILIAGSRYTLGTNVPAYSINAPSSNSGISSNYKNNLFGICINYDFIYTISNARDGTNGYGATSNTHISIYPYFRETYPTTAVIYPYMMKYEYVSSRKSLFKEYVQLATTTIPGCPESGLIDGTPQPTTTLSTATTTLSPLQLGTPCRYIKITKSDNNIEILQVLAIDKTGKNVAFGANVSVLPTTLETVGRKQYITNGTYAVNSPVVNPPFIRALTTYLKTIGSNSALGSIASDPITGNIYVYDLHKKSLQTVSSDLTQLGTPIYFPADAGPYISITAYNRYVYAVDWSSSRLFSVNFSVSSSLTVIQINTHVSGNNWLNGPIAISNVVNNKFYIINSNVKSIISIDIANNNAIGMSASPGGAWGGINTDSFIKLLGIAVDSNNIGYALDNGSRIIKFEFDTNTSSVFVGSTNTGYTDSAGTSARFNATDSNSVYAITIDSYNNLFLADITNNAIRKIDTITANVTTYTTLVTVTNAVYTLGSRVLPNVITTPQGNTTISSRYLMNLYGLCIVNNTLYTVSNARDTGTTGSNWVPNPTNNTSIVSYTYRADGGILPASSYFTVSKPPILNGNNILSSLDSNSSLGSITYDSSTGFIFIFDLHKMKILKVTTDLNSFTVYADFTSYTSLSISAYNGTIYAVDLNTDTFFSVNSSGTKTIINTTVSGNNLLYQPYAISNVVNNTLYIVNRLKTIVSVNILNNTITTIASNDGTLSTASLPVFSDNSIPAIVVDSNGILYVSVLHSIYKLNRQTNAVELFAGSTTFGYKDDVGSAARFNKITAITIDSQNNIYVTDFFNKAIRRINSGGNVTTHVSMSSVSGAINTPEVTFAPSITSAPSGNTNIQTTYMNNLYSLCIVGSNIYSISNARDTGYNATTYVPNPTNNTSVTCYTNINSAQGTPVVPVSPLTLEIDLGTTQEITAIRYIKKSTNYSPVGLIFTLLDSTRAQVTTPKQVLIDLGTTTFDLRNTNLTPAQRATAPLTIIPRRNGVCGIMGRYIKLSTPSAGYYYAISQISVITTDGSNLALGRPATAIIGGEVYNPAKILDGRYASLVESSSFVQTSNSTNDFIMIDLEAEYDITAVNLYYALSTTTSASIQNIGLLQILTEDLQISANTNTSKYHTTMKKEILDFRRPLQSRGCPISVKWPPFYGTAGVIARYIRLKKVGTIAFSKLEVVDRTGLDIAQYKKVSVASGASTAQKGVSNQKGVSGSNMFSREILDGYKSDVNNMNQYFSVDFGTAKEICCINIYCCTDDINSSFMQGLTVSLYDSDPDSSSTTPLITYTPIADGRLIQVFDTRYEPNTSEYPTSVTRTVSRYGSFGIYAQSVYVYGSTIPTTCTIVDATGTAIIPVSSSGVNPRIYTLPTRMYEITSVILNSVGTRVELYDCYSSIVGEATTATSTLDSTIIFADFRNLLNDSPNIYAPFKPYNLKRGGYRLSAFNSGAGTSYSSTGVKARYVKIIPKDASTPLYISQIIAVDEFGINRAFQKQTFNVNIVGQPSSLNFPPDGKNAVDGMYEAQIDNLEFIDLYFTKYKRKFNNMSYVSYVAPASTSGPPQAAFGAIQEMPYAFYIDLELDTTTDSSLMDPTNRKEYSINSIIYVASKEGGAQSEGVIVQLLDDNLQIVGTQIITNMINIFGVDILDFRSNTGLSMTSLPNRVEVRERIITIGPQNCGINTQYIRIEQTNPIYPLQLSYVIITDTTGYDIAMYKPTYSSSNIKESYSIVDGKRYLKNSINAFTTSIEQNQFVEINLEKEYELMSLSVGDIFGSSAGFSTLRVRLYNKDRDVIGSYASLVPANIKSALGYQATATDTIKDIPLDTSNFMYLSKIGVSIADHLTAYKYQSGLLAVAAVTAYSTITTLPSLLTPLSGSGSCSTQIILTQQYTRVNGGIPTRYVRLYNVGNYIQVSQIMVYDTTGTNVAYRASTYATSTLPQRYAAYATDGYGGFFHQPRAETNCFISGNLQYDYLEIDLGAIYNIVAVRYIPPTTNLSRNIGVRVQLRGYNSVITTAVANAPIVTLSEMIVTTHGDTTLDFRIYSPDAPSIDKVISPKITTLFIIPASNNTITGFCIKEDNIKWNPTLTVDTYYYVDPSIKTMRAIYINSSGTRSYSTGSQPDYYINTTASSMMGVYYSPSYLRYIYIADYTGNKVFQIKLASDEAYNDVKAGDMFLITGVTNPYSLTGYNNMLYICENRIGGNIYSFNEAPFNGTLTPIYTNKDYMASITVNSAGELLVCVGSTKQVLRISTGGSLLSVFAAPSGTADNIIPLENPSGIAVDTVNNIVFISDVQTNIIYAVTPSGWIILAGNGSPGYTGDGGQAAYARLDGPFFLQYNKGALYIADKNNKCIRKIDLQSGTSAAILPTTTNFRPEGFITTTIPGTSATGSAPTSTAIISRPTTYDTYIKNINLPIISQIYDGVGETSSLYIDQALGRMYMHTGLRLYKSEISSNFMNFSPLFNVNNDTIGFVKSITSDTTMLYLASNSKNKIFSVDINTINVSLVCGNGQSRYSPDGTIATDASIIPTAVHYNKLTNSLYFTDCQATCGLVRRIDSFGKIQTIVGSYSLTLNNIDTTTYYTNMLDTVKPETNPLAVYLSNPCAIATDSYGNIYIADSGTHCIHRLTPTGLLQPVCGPFRITSNPISFFNETATDMSYPAYSVKINTPSSLAFDLDMNLYCTSLNGGQIVKISKLNDNVEPEVRVISGLGVDINSSSIYLSDSHPAKYSSLRLPTNIIYSYDTNSLYFKNQQYIRRITLPYNDILYKGNNLILPYGIVEDIKSSVSCNFMTITFNNIMYYSDSANRNIMRLIIDDAALSTTTVIYDPNTTPNDICLYIDQYIYLTDSVNKKIKRLRLSNNALDTIYTDTDIPKYVRVHDNGSIFVGYESYIKTGNVKNQTLQLTNISIDELYSNFGPIELDRINNRLYISVKPNPNTPNINTILQYNINFTHTPTQPTTLSLTGLSTTTLQNITCDYAGNIYCSDSTNVYYIQKDSTNLITLYTGVLNPTSICYFENKIYVADTGNNRYITLNSNAPSSATIDNLNFQLSIPSGIYVNVSNMYITDKGNNLIRIKNRSTGDWTSISINSPVGIAVDNNNTIYYTSNNYLYKIIGTTSTIVSTLEYNIGQLSIDSANNLYTIDLAGNIYKITTAGIRTIINQITELKGFALSEAAVFDTKYYYITQSNCKFFMIANIVSLNSNPNTWTIPATITSLAIYGNSAYCSASNNIIYKLDTDSNVIPICGPDSTPISTFPSPSLLTNLTNVKSFAFTNTGTMIISDATRFLKLNVRQEMNLRKLYTLAGYPNKSSNSGDGQLASVAHLNNPGGTCFDKAGNIFIADTGNNSVRRIDAITGIITTVVSNLIGIIDVQVNSTGALYLLTPNKLYRSTLTSSTTYSVPIIFAGEGLTIIDNVPALVCKIHNARSIRLDSHGNIYIVSSNPITAILNSAIRVANSATLTFLNLTLYGISSSSPIIPTPTASTVTSGSLYNNQQNLNSLYGNGGTPNNPLVNSLLYIKNRDYANFININGLATKLTTLLGIIRIQMQNWAGIKGLIQSTLDARAVNYNIPSSVLILPSGTGIPPSVSQQANNGADQLISMLNAIDYNIAFFPTYSGLGIPSFTRYATRGFDEADTHYGLYKKVLSCMNTGYITQDLTNLKNYLNTLFNTAGSASSPNIDNIPLVANILTAKQTADSSTTAARTTYFGNATWGVQATFGSEYEYNNKYIATYGSLTAPTTAPTGGTQLIYNNHYNALQTALQTDITAISPTEAQISTAIASVGCRIQKIDLYGIINTCVESSDVTVKEPIGLAFDSSNNLYFVDHYTRDLYMIPSGTMNLNITNAVYNNYCVVRLSYRPYGIAIDNNKESATENNIYVSFNGNDTTYNCNACIQHQIHLLNRPASSSIPLITTGIVQSESAVSFGSGSAAVSPYSEFYGNRTGAAIKNPQLLSIDKNNRLIFTQSELNSVIITPLNVYSDNIRRIKKIRLEPASPGKRVAIKKIGPMVYKEQSVTIEGINPTYYTISASSNSLAATTDRFPIYTLSTDTNAFIEISFPELIYTALITFKAERDQIDAVGMKVLLFDNLGNLVSNRLTTHKILDQTTGCEIFYNTYNVSNS